MSSRLPRTFLFVATILACAVATPHSSLAQEDGSSEQLTPLQIQTAEAPKPPATSEAESGPETVMPLPEGEGQGAASTVLPAAQHGSLPVGETFILANQAYEEGRYPVAVELYSSLVDQGYDTAEVLFNLGNAHLRAGDLGRAVASFRRSLVRSPRDPETLDNLRFARRSARDAIAAPEPSAFARTLFFWHYGLSRAGLVKAGAILSFLFWGLMIANLYRRDEILRWATGLVLVVLLAVAGSIAFKTWAPGRIAVILPAEVEVYSGTDRASVVRFELHAGTEVRASRVSAGWVRIELPDGQQGWIEADQVDLVVVR